MPKSHQSRLTQADKRDRLPVKLCESCMEPTENPAFSMHVDCWRLNQGLGPLPEKPVRLCRFCEAPTFKPNRSTCDPCRRSCLGLKPKTTWVDHPDRRDQRFRDGNGPDEIGTPRQRPHDGFTEWPNDGPRNVELYVKSDDDDDLCHQALDQDPKRH